MRQCMFKLIPLMIFIGLALSFSLLSMQAQELVPSEPDKIILEGPTHILVAPLQTHVDYRIKISNSGSVSQTGQITIDGSELESIEASRWVGAVSCSNSGKLSQCSFLLLVGEEAEINVRATRPEAGNWWSVNHCIVLTDTCHLTTIQALEFNWRSYLPIINRWG